METKSWPITPDGSIQCQQLTAEYLDEAVDVMEDAFFRFENVCKAIGLGNDSVAIAELKELTRATARDGVTVIAIDKTKNKVVGCAFNKIQVKENPDKDDDTPYFEAFAKSCKTARSQEVLRFMVTIDNLCSLFDLCKVDCLMEIMFLGTLPEYRGKGIAKRLCEVSIEIAKTLLDGANVKRSVDGRQLSLEPVPKIASAIFTSFITQKIGKSLGFQVAAEKDFDSFVFQGVNYTSVIGNETPKVTLEYKILE